MVRNCQVFKIEKLQSNSSSNHFQHVWLMLTHTVPQSLVEFYLIKCKQVTISPYEKLSKAHIPPSSVRLIWLQTNKKSSGSLWCSQAVKTDANDALLCLLKSGQVLSLDTIQKCQDRVRMETGVLDKSRFKKQ